MYGPSGNQISKRRYDLTVLKNGEIVANEYGLTPQEKKEFAAEYRSEGYTVNSEESYSVTKNRKVIGEKPVDNNKAMPNETRFTPGPVAMTERKIEQQRVENRARAQEKLAQKTNDHGKTIVHRNRNGRDKNSPMHDLFIASLKKNGYKVKNLVTGKFFYGSQSDVVRYLDGRINRQGYKISDFEILYIGE